MPLNSTLATERPAPTGTWRSRPHRPLWSRFSTAHGLMVLSGLLTFVLVVSAMGGPEARLTVAAAKGDIPSGAPLTRDLLRQVDLPADSDLAGATVPLERLAGGAQVAARPIAAGELLRPSDLGGAVSGANRLRAMSIPVKRERAVGGALRVGDQVDVVDVVEGTARWVVTGAQVIEVSKSASSGGIVREVGGTYHVVVEVNEEQALALAEALTHDTVSVVRSTGAQAPQLTEANRAKNGSPSSAQAEGPSAQPSTPPVVESPSSAPPASGS